MIDGNALDAALLPAVGDWVRSHRRDEPTTGLEIALNPADLEDVRTASAEAVPARSSIIGEPVRWRGIPMVADVEVPAGGAVLRQAWKLTLLP